MVPDMTYNVFGRTLNLAQSINLFVCATSSADLHKSWLMFILLAFVADDVL